jgi:aryl-alcohol dehydrogenase-like predicted oxidoreductase
VFFNELGRTGLKVSVICLGTMTWGRQNTQEEAFEQMDYAISQGVNFFDTAEMYAVPPTEKTYGKTETIIGNWLSESRSRDKIIIATKVAGPGLSWVRNGKSNHSRKQIEEALEGSLKRLQTDYIDLYQLHWPRRPHYHFGRHWDYDPTDINAPDEKESFLETLQTLDDLIKAGKIRHIGLSNETAWGVMSFLHLSGLHGLPRMASIQNEYSLTCRIFEPDLAEVSIHEDIGLLAYSPLAAGALSGKYLNGNIPEGSRRTLLTSPSHRDTEMADKAIKSYIKIAEKYNLDVCQMALSYVNNKPFLTSNIIGATTMEQLKSNIASANIVLEKDCLQDIEKAHKATPMPY